MNIAVYTLTSVSEAVLTSPYIVVLLTLIAVLYVRNNRTVTMQKMVIGESINTAFELTISQVVLGILAGALGSVILSYLGIVFDNEITISLLFMISIILMLFRSRFVCFSYSAGILSIISVIYQIYQRISGNSLVQYSFLKTDVVMIISLVAVLHVVEGILVMLDGHRGAIPVFTSKNDKIIGGFALKRYWPIPIAVMFLMHNISTADTFNVATPNFWPIIKSNYFKAAANIAIDVLPFYGMIGYNSVTFTKDRKEKTVISGSLIIIYSLTLFALAQVSVSNLYLQFLVLIFAPAAHEGMIAFQRYLEMKGSPKYISSDEGIMVLDVAPNSPANEMGIKSGDLLVEVNNAKIENEEKISEAIRECSNFIWFKVKKVTGKFEQVSYNKLNNEKRLGIVFVPRGVPKDSMVIKLDETKFGEVLDKIKNKDKDE